MGCIASVLIRWIGVARRWIKIVQSQTPIVEHPPQCRHELSIGMQLADDLLRGLIITRLSQAVPSFILQFPHMQLKIVLPDPRPLCVRNGHDVQQSSGGGAAARRGRWRLWTS